MRNYLECRNGLIHADGGSGDDHTLCGLTSENTIPSISDYNMRAGEPNPFRVGVKASPLHSAS